MDWASESGHASTSETHNSGRLQIKKGFVNVSEGPFGDVGGLMIKRYNHRYETILLRGFSLKPLNQGFLGKPSLQRTKINLMKAFNFFCLQYTCRRREQQEIFLFTPGN